VEEHHLHIRSKGSGAPREYTSAGQHLLPCNAMIRTFVITDANGCTTIATTVSPITDPTVTATVNASCNGIRWFSNLNRAGGSGGYLTVTTLRQDLLLMLLFTGLAAGTYTFLRDNKVVQVQY
jgi:hypothetical protein